jgi:hypothetical protein
MDKDVPDEVKRWIGLKHWESCPLIRWRNPEEITERDGSEVTEFEQASLASQVQSNNNNPPGPKRMVVHARMEATIQSLFHIPRSNSDELIVYRSVEERIQIRKQRRKQLLWPRGWIPQNTNSRLVQKEAGPDEAQESADQYGSGTCRLDIL